MDTQNTPIHINLWHNDFWKLTLANLLLSVSVYMLMVGIPFNMIANDYSRWQVGVVMGVFGIGIFLFGGFMSRWVQVHRRNRVCQLAILGVIISIAGLYYQDTTPANRLDYYIYLGLRLFMGACYGLATMVMTSTLIIDICESFQRTEANHATAWFSRMAMSIGPVVGFAILHKLDYNTLLVVAIGCAVASLFLMSLVKFPFKAPGENLSIFSLDRFFLPNAIPLFLVTMLVTATMGLMFSTITTTSFYGMLMVGFLLALLAERFVFVNAELKSEAISGLIAISSAFLLLLFHPDSMAYRIAPVLTGFGLGIIGSRFLLFFIKLSKHCQRGSSQSMFFLAWEFGIALGLFGGYSILSSTRLILSVGVSFAVITLIIYNFILHPWYMKNKNR